MADSKRQYVFEYDPEKNEWQVCSTGDNHEIVCCRGVGDNGFDDAYASLAAWVLEREAFSRFGHNEKWVKVWTEDGDQLVYAPAEKLIGNEV